MVNSASEIVARKTGRLGHLTLDRPAAINALSPAMVGALDRTLAAWEADPEVHTVLLTGAGERGFCAGGDIVAVRAAIDAGAPERARGFWREEYLLDARIALYPKPVVVVMDGITMGGGVGLACHATHRLVTERAVVAMPETAIGFHPDCGVAYRLSRAPGQLGTYVALTGCRLGAPDAIACGLADRLLPAAGISQLTESLADEDPDAVLGRLLPEDDAEAGRVRKGEWIDAAFAGDSVEEILVALRTWPEPLAREAAAEIARMSPTALKVTLAALRRAGEMGTVEECFVQDYRVSSACADDGDLVEGIRAAVVDKDREPRWNPATLAEVDSEVVDRHFESVADDLAAASPVGRR